MTTNHLITLVENYRKSCGDSMAYVAKQCDISRATYWRIVKGKTASIEFDLAVNLLRYAGYKITVKL